MQTSPPGPVRIAPVWQTREAAPFSPDGNLVAARSSYGKAYVRSVATGKPGGRSLTLTAVPGAASERVLRGH